MSSTNEVIESAVSQLRKSPLFNLSLGAKELFHSDFLDWLSRSYPSSVMPIFAKRMTIYPNISVDWKVEREKGHQDLKFSFNDGSVLVVENKVKSIPNKEQLQKYCHKYLGKPHHTFLLLSLLKPEFITSNDDIIKLGDDCHWAFLDYQRLAQELQSILPLVEQQNTYHGKLLSDYIEFIDLLSKIANASARVTESSENLFSYHQYMHILRDLRIHDLFYKSIFSNMAQLMITKLQNIGHIVQKDRSPNKGKKEEIFVDSNFTHGTGMCTVYYVIIGEKEEGGPCIMFIQLQDDMFRLFFHIKGKKRSMKIAEIIADENLWFNFDKLPESSIIKRFRKEKHFNSYNKTDLYRYKLIHNISPEELAKIIISYVDQLKKNANRIRGIVKEN
jgi:hypothetical protein